MNRSTSFIPAALILVAALVSCVAAAQAEDASPAWQRRGKLTDERLTALSQRLDPFRARLDRAVADIPALAAKLAGTQSGPTRIGWQVLPRIVPDAKRPATPGKPFPVWYTWAGSDERISDAGKLVQDGIAALDRADAERASDAALAKRHDELAKAVDAAIAAEEKRREAQSYVSYNWLWQRAIPRERARFDEETRLYDAILERQSIRETLASGPRDDEAALRAREAELTRQVQGHGQEIFPPAYLSVRRTSRKSFVIHVPLATDIEDDAFLAAFVRAAETAWQAEADQAGQGTTYGVRIELRRIPVATLYPDGDAPSPGAAIDTSAHAARFPSDAGVLTTGTQSTHAIIGRSILLGPDDLAPNILAHEFGHVLGFSDVYVRGFRDLGEEGLQVMEIVADPDDIMSDPRIGRALASQLERLVVMKTKAPSRRPRLDRYNGARVSPNP